MVQTFFDKFLTTITPIFVVYVITSTIAGIMWGVQLQSRVAFNTQLIADMTRDIRRLDEYGSKRLAVVEDRQLHLIAEYNSRLIELITRVEKILEEMRIERRRTSPN